MEARGHWRDSEENRFPVNFPFTPDQLPPGQARGMLETVDPGTHVELSVVRLALDATWSPGLTARVAVDAVDLHDRNPTSTDDEVDVDELWLRFGREAPPATAPERPGGWVKLGKFPKFERQDDRHLESYGLVSTAFNRFEDLGVEAGLDLGRHARLVASATRGNPVFLRDPNALAGDNGTAERLTPPNPDPELGSGVPILYDAEVEPEDGGDPELGGGLGLRWSDPQGNGVELLVFGYQRELAERVEIEGSRYGGDLDLLRGPFNAFPFPLQGDDKREVGASLWLYLGGVSLFGQFVDQDLAGLGRTGFETELAWRIGLPSGLAVRGRPLFPAVAPAVRYSRLDPDFAAPAVTPSPSFAWEWEKVDVGVRLTLVEGVDLTVEYARNEFVRAVGPARNDELLATARWKVGR